MALFRIKFYLSIIFILVLVVLALPEFSLNTGGKDYRYPSVGFGKIGIGADYGSFRKSKDIFPSEKLFSEVDFTESTLTNEEKLTEVEKIKDVVRQRVDFANLYDVIVKYEITGEKYYITLEFPEYYSYADVYARWLTKKGEIEFFASQTDVGQNTLDLLDYDVENVDISGSIAFVDSAGQTTSRVSVPNLELTINPNKTVTIDYIKNLGSTASEGSVTPRLNIDGLYTMDVIAHEKSNNKLRAILSGVGIPTDADPGSKFGKDILNITQAYFIEKEPLKFSVNLTNITEPVAPIFNPEGGTFMAATIIFGAATVAIFIFKRLNFKRSLLFVLLTASNILLTVNLLKLINYYISSGLVVGFLIAFIINTIILAELLSTETTAVEKNNVNFRVLSTFTLLAALGLYTLRININVYNDLLAVIIAFSISVIFNSFLITKFYTTDFIRKNRNLSDLLIKIKK